jgi:hypothetical protein
LACVDFFTQEIHPRKLHCDTVNELIYAAQSWSVQLPQRQQEVRNGTYFLDYDPLHPNPFDLVRVVEDTDGSPTLMLSRHPLLGQSPGARRALHFEWYCSNAFVVSFDLHMSATSRFLIEKALELLGAKLTACLITPMAGIDSPRLHINFGEIESGVTFASLLQWFRLFYEGSLSEGKLGSIQTGFGTGPPNPSQYLLVFDPHEDDIYEADQNAINNVTSQLRLEALRVANGSVDIKRHVYEWLANDDKPLTPRNRLAIAREKVYRMIGPVFRELKYTGAMRKYL